MGCGRSTAAVRPSSPRSPPLPRDVSGEDVGRRVRRAEAELRVALRQREGFSRGYEEWAAHLRALAAKGVPAHFRRVAWPHFCGVEDAMLRQRALYEGLASRRVPAACAEQIAKDLARTLPSHAFFREFDGAAALERLLRALAVAHPRVGYVQGMNYVGAVLLMHMGEQEAFWVFTAFLRRFRLGEYYEEGMVRLTASMEALGEQLRVVAPRLAAHLGRENVEPFVFSSPWFLTLFAYNLPSVELVARVWDVMLVDCFLSAEQRRLMVASPLPPHHTGEASPVGVIIEAMSILSDEPSRVGDGGRALGAAVVRADPPMSPSAVVGVGKRKEEGEEGAERRRRRRRRRRRESGEGKEMGMNRRQEEDEKGESGSDEEEKVDEEAEEGDDALEGVMRALAQGPTSVGCDDVVFHFGLAYVLHMEARLRKASFDEATAMLRDMQVTAASLPALFRRHRQLVEGAAADVGD